ncbi:unnamed protein product [Dracunculus medinensis]|uniref:Protein pellino n=1 Tax=Dracunculus medinensis TaxID=318479 RepID=A0A0N4U4S2_DRAME|nr:unnamed protein product [Dracunculus medinensis]
MSAVNKERACCNDGGICKYGELIVLGSSSLDDEPLWKVKRRRAKLELFKRASSNGIKKGCSSSVNVSPLRNEAIMNPSKHVVSYSFPGHTVIVEYIPDNTKDMFQVIILLNIFQTVKESRILVAELHTYVASSVEVQQHEFFLTRNEAAFFKIGRSTEPQIDFTVVDSWLGAGDKIVVSPRDSNFYVDSLLQANFDHKGHVVSEVPISSTISRYACRILIDRKEPHRAFLYAAGFDASSNICLGEKAIKWTKENGEMDALTTNGVWILHPNQKPSEKIVNNDEAVNLFNWREVSLDGDIYEVRQLRSSSKRGKFLTSETNELRDGTLIDLCGATLLWRTSQGLAKSPSFSELDSRIKIGDKEHKAVPLMDYNRTAQRGLVSLKNTGVSELLLLFLMWVKILRLNELNAGKPQCPVNLNTLIVSRKKFLGKKESSRQPYVYIACGHVQGKHDWGIQKNENSCTTYKCPVCLEKSTRVIQLVMGMEPAFHLDSGILNYAFNPCGHLASFATVRYWSRISVPYDAYNHSSLCPFCTNLLDKNKPYVRVIFQDHLDD